MSNAWSFYIIALTAAFIIATLMLLRMTSRVNKDEIDAETTGHVWDGDLREYNNPLPRWWLWLFYITIIFSVAYLVLYPGMGNFAGVLGWSSTEQYDQQIAQAEERYQPIFAAFAERPITDLAKDGAALSAGYNLYVNECAQCHGSDGRGAKGFPNLADNDWLWGGEPETIVTTLRHGRNGAMPPWGAALQEQGVNEVTQYVLKMGGLDHEPALAEAGGAKYQMFCVACHGVNGQGNPMLGAPNLTDDIWLHGSDEAAIADIITNGKQNQMPAFQDRLGEERIHVVAAYVHSLSAQ